MRGRVVTVLALGVLLFFAYAFVAPFGERAVRDACASEGGLQISKTDDVDGYLNQGWTVDGKQVMADCFICASQVADREFVYVDFERTEAMDAGEPGLYRFALGPELAGRVNCTGGNFDGMPAGQCVTVRKVEGATGARYGYRREWTTRNPIYGGEFREMRQAIYELASGKPIATHRYFDYATPAENRGKFERGYHCRKSPIDPSDAKAFFLRTLHVKPPN
jgi:hypothetical protein